MPQGIRIISNDYIVQNINRPFVELSGVSSEEAIGKKCWEVFPSPFCHTDECRLKRILEGKQMVQAEIERQNKDGGTTPCIVRAFPLKDKTGKLIGVMESFKDITEKKQLQAKVDETEERYRALIELTSEVGEGILMLQDINGIEGAIIFASKQSSRMTGYSNEELLGKSLFDLIISKDRQDSLERHRQKMRGESLPSLYEMAIIKKDSAELPIELTSAITRYRDSMRTRRPSTKSDRKEDIESDCKLS